MASERLESIDSRLALRVYAASVGLAGFVVLGWGPVWLGAHLPELPWGRAALIRISGALMIAAAMSAQGLASTEFLTRRRGLSWFIAAHGVVWLMLLVQIAGPLGGILIVQQVAWALLMVILGLLYIRLPADPVPPSHLSLFTLPTVDKARVQYEQQIREAAAQEERNRLARDLHDAVKQQIFAIQTSAATAEARFDADPTGARNAVVQIRQSAREAMAEMEAMLDQLRAEPLGNAGLIEAIRKQCEALAFRTGADVRVRIGRLPPETNLEPGTHRAVFRVVQEALANAARHARASQIEVSVDSTSARLVIRILDDGVGYEGGLPSHGTGIQGMQARAREIGGSVELGHPEGGGTVVTVSVPYETAGGLESRRKQALGFSLAFGLGGLVSLLNLLRNGPVFGNVFLGFFCFAFVHHARTWWRLRRGVHPRHAASPGHPS